MASQYLLDTNAAIARINADSTLERVLVSADEIFVPVIVLAELYYGAENSQRVKESIEQVELLRQSVVVLNCDEDTAREFGIVAHEQRRKGRMIPENDMWIASIARQHMLTLITRDTHFVSVNRLNILDW